MKVKIGILYSKFKFINKFNTSMKWEFDKMLIQMYTEINFPMSYTFEEKIE